MGTVTVFTSLFVGVALLVLGTGLLGTLLGIRMAEAEVPALSVGIIMTGYFAGQLSGALVLQGWIQRVGHIRTYAACTATLAAAVAAHPFAVDVPFWAGLRFLQGLCMAGLLMCVESWLNGRASRATRGRVLASYMTVFYGAFAASQVLLGLPAPDPFGLFVVASILISLAAIPVVLTSAEAPRLETRPGKSLKDLYAISPTSITGALLSGVILGVFYGLTAYALSASGLAAGDIASFITAVVLGGLAMQWPIGRLSDRWDRRGVIAVVSLLTAASAAGVGILVSGPFTALLAAGVCFGGFSFTLYPLCVANAHDHIDEADVVGTSRGLLVAYSIGAVFGPAVGATVLQIAPEGVFYFIAAVAVLSFSVVIMRMKVAAPPPPEMQSPFRVLPRTTPEVAELDPRGE